jgi:hypothetical protein
MHLQVPKAVEAIVRTALGIGKMAMPVGHVYRGQEMKDETKIYQQRLE